MKAKLLDKWAEKHCFCIECHSTRFSHNARGLCKSCWGKKWRTEHKPQYQTVHFWCPHCRLNINTGIDVREVNKSIALIQEKQLLHKQFFHYQVADLSDCF